MNHLKISNKGELDIKALTLFGASTKRGNSGKIGMFGSGNKFAIAYLTRNKIPFKIYSGLEEIKITGKQTIFGEMSFEQIVVNGKETSITTEAGKDWELWQALREFYSNALDEGVLEFGIKHDIEPVEGETHIYVENTPEVKKIYEKWYFYFASDTPFLFKNATGSILQKRGDTINFFRKGIRINETSQEKKSIFDYNIDNIGINESRLASESYMKCAAWKLILECDNVVMIKDFLERISDSTLWEHNTYLNYWTDYKADFSQAWAEVIQGRRFCPVDYGGYVKEHLRDVTYFVPKDLYKLIIHKWGEQYSAIKVKGTKLLYEEVELQPLYENSINQVRQFFDICKWEIKHPIKVVRFFFEVGTSDHVLGLAEDGHILLSEKLFDLGLFECAQTIYEEEMHLRSGAADKTRKFQNALIRENINYMKKLNAINI